LNDSYNLFHHPEDLADELVAEGYAAVKTWSFDRAAHQHGGMRISLSDLEHAVAPLRRIRDRVGDKLEILIDGHGFFVLPAALRIADAMREIKPRWLEDILETDNLETLGDFAHVLSRQAADYVMIDPTWVGGISETARLAHLAQTYNVPPTMHDCTVRAHIRSFYKDVIDKPIVIEAGYAKLPTGPGLGVTLNPDLFGEDRADYRVSRG